MVLCICPLVGVSVCASVCVQVSYPQVLANIKVDEQRARLNPLNIDS